VFVATCKEICRLLGACGLIFTFTARAQTAGAAAAGGTTATAGTLGSGNNSAAPATTGTAGRNDRCRTAAQGQSLSTIPGQSVSVIPSTAGAAANLELSRQPHLNTITTQAPPA